MRRKTNKYAHIKNAADLQAELAKLQIKKQLLRQDIRDNIDSAKSWLKPSNIILSALGFSTPANQDEVESDNLMSKITGMIKTFTIAKSGLSALKLISRIFRRRK